MPLGAWPGTAPFCAVGVAVDVGQGTVGVLGFTGCAGPVGVGAGLLGVGGAWVAPGPAALVVMGVGGPIVEAGGVICPEAPVVVGGGGGAVGRAWAIAQLAQHSSEKMNESRMIMGSLRFEIRAFVKSRLPAESLLSG
ncbi:MAG: hypothetical protein ACM3WP_03315 [Acidobacteriota bacterium]